MKQRVPFLSNILLQAEISATYVGAAVKACQLGLISETSMMNVVKAAQESLEETSRTSEKWQDLYRDVSDAYKTIDGRN